MFIPGFAVSEFRATMVLKGGLNKDRLPLLFSRGCFGFSYTFLVSLSLALIIIANPALAGAPADTDADTDLMPAEKAQALTPGTVDSNLFDYYLSLYKGLGISTSLMDSGSQARENSRFLGIHEQTGGRTAGNDRLPDRVDQRGVEGDDLPALCGDGHDGTHDEVVQMLQSSKSPALRKDAVRCLGMVGVPADLPLLEQALSGDPAMEVRIAAAKSMIFLDHKDSFHKVWDAIINEGLDGEEALLEMLYQRDPENLRKRLLEQMGKGNTFVPLLLVRFASRFKDDETYDHLFSLAVDESDWKNLASLLAADILSEDPSPELRSQLIAIAWGNEPEARLRAASALGKADFPGSTSALIEALDDPDTRVSCCAAKGLEGRNEVKIVASILSYMTRNNKCDEAEAVLSGFSNPEAAPELIKAVDNPVPKIRISAATALGNFTTDVVHSTLVKALDHDDYQVRMEALKSLARLDSPSLSIFCKRALEDQIWQVRQTAVQVLGDVDNADAGMSLCMALFDQSGEVKNTAISVLGKRVFTAGEGSNVAIVGCLMGALQNNRGEVANGIVSTLGRLGDPVASPAIIDAAIQGKVDPELAITVVENVGGYDGDMDFIKARLLPGTDGLIRTRSPLDERDIDFTPSDGKGDQTETGMVVPFEGNDLTPQKLLEQVRYFTPREKTFAFKILTSMDEPTPVELVKDHLVQENCATVALAVEEAIQWKMESVIDSLGKLRPICTSKRSIAMEVIRALGLWGTDEAVDLLLQFTDHTDYGSYKGYIFRNLGKTRNPGAVKPLLKWLEANPAIEDDSTRYQVKEVITALGENGSPEAIPYLMRFFPDEGSLFMDDNLFIEKYLREDVVGGENRPGYRTRKESAYLGWRKEAFTALMRIGGKEAVAVLRKAMERDPSREAPVFLEAVRLGAISLLDDPEDEAAVSFLIDLAQGDPLIRFRIKAVRQLGHLSTEKVPALMADIVLNDPDMSVKSEAFRVLAETTGKGRELGYAALEKSSDPEVRFLLARSRWEEGDTRGTEQLLEMVYSPDRDVRNGARWILGDFESSRVNDSWEHLTSVPDPEIRLLALESAVVLSHPDLVRLYSLALADPDHRIRLKAAALWGEQGQESQAEALLAILGRDGVSADPGRYYDAIANPEGLEALLHLNRHSAGVVQENTRKGLLSCDWPGPVKLELERILAPTGIGVAGENVPNTGRIADRGNGSFSNEPDMFKGQDYRMREALFGKITRREELGRPFTQELKRDLDVLLKYYTDKASDHPQDLSVLLRLGALHRINGDLSVAERYFAQALFMEPFSPVVLNSIGHHSWRTGRWDRAESFYLYAAAMGGGSVESLVNLGILYLETGEDRKAAICFNRAIRIDPESDRSYTHLGEIWKRIGDKDEAQRFFARALAINPKNSVSAFRLGDIYLKDNHIGDGLELFRRSIDADPGYANPYFAIAWVKKNLYHNPEAAIEPLEEYLNNQDVDPYYAEKANSWIKLLRGP